MKAVRIHEYGNENVLKYEDVPIPEIQDDDILIKIYAAGVNPLDWQIREGYLKEIIPHEFPLTLGWDVSGVVETVGSKVTNFQEGDAVYACTNVMRHGAYAEYIAVKSHEVALKPKSIDHNHSAAIPMAGLTAWQGLFEVANLTQGQRVLIHAAAGGVGHYAVQLAKTRGAYVIGTASAGKHEFLRELGVDEALDYTSVKFEDKVKDVDVVFDAIGGDTLERSWQVLKPGGILVSIAGMPSEEKSKAHNVRSSYVIIQPNAGQLSEIADLVDQGKIQTHLEKLFPLQQAKDAHLLSQTGRVSGKIVLQVAA